MERTIRAQAKELAGIFYEDNRSPKFRAAFPTLEHYMKGLWVQRDGSIKVYRPGWLHHVELARKMLRVMLKQSDVRVHPNVKEGIYKALLEDGKRATAPTAKRLTQAKVA